MYRVLCLPVFKRAVLGRKLSEYCPTKGKTKFGNVFEYAEIAPANIRRTSAIRYTSEMTLALDENLNSELFYLPT